MSTAYQERCPRCQGKGTIVRDGPSEHEYDSHFPCPRCTVDRTAPKGTGCIPVENEAAAMAQGAVWDLLQCEHCHGTGEVHPTDRPYMNHEIHDCPECGGSGVAEVQGSSDD
jgi:DnaJ-class molecular chaperone